jgi:hypothetical protein
VRLDVENEKNLTPMYVFGFWWVMDLIEAKIRECTTTIQKASIVM